MLYRFPAIDPPTFRERVERIVTRERKRDRRPDRGRENDR
jgi:hypothetical protein